MESPVVASGAYAVLGAFTGWLSLLVFPHRIVRRSRVHGISLIVSPIVAGLVMSSIGSLMRRYGKAAIQIESFWCGFAFALGMALVRLFGAD